jgi:hypothetical protein
VYSPNSLLRESVTSGDLHRRMALDEDPAPRTPQPPLGRPETRTGPRGEGLCGRRWGGREPRAPTPHTRRGTA